MNQQISGVDAIFRYLTPWASLYFFILLSSIIAVPFLQYDLVSALSGTRKALRVNNVKCRLCDRAADMK